MFEVDFVTMLTNLSKDFGLGGTVWNLVNVFCWFMAVVLAILAAVQMKSAAEERQLTYKAPFMTFLAAALLASAPTALVSTAMVFFGNDANTSPFQYVTPGATPTPTRALLTIVQMVGYIFFVRGIFELKRAGEPNRYQGASVGKAFTILGAGMAGVYINFVLGTIGKTTGWNVEAFIGP